MLFNSYEYIFFFLPVSFFVYFWLNQKRLTVAAKGWLVISSMFFYAWWSIAFVWLLLTSILVNFVVGNELTLVRENNSKKSTLVFNRKMLLIGGVSFNLGLLCFFKYTDFIVANLNALGANLNMPGIVLPLAISFFTFQQIAYLVDCYRKETSEYDFLNYAVFVTFFPQLIAGPIVHHKEMMPQFSSRMNLVKRYKNIVLGLFIFSVGLFKKVVIADTFAKWVDPGFDTSLALNVIEAWMASLSYTFQLYFDFSGYVDMAIGSSLLFNIRLPVNFNSPYKALNIRDFWHRWHITLSRFLREYLYIPLGGNRTSEVMTYVNIFITFLLGGLWHGASWMFVIWGALHGLAMIVHRIWSRIGVRMPVALAWFITFNFINFAWIFFRAPDMNAAKRIIMGMLGMGEQLPWSLILQIESFWQSNEIEFDVLVNEVYWGFDTLYWVLAGFVLVLGFHNTSTRYLNRQCHFALMTHRWAIFHALLFVTSIFVMTATEEVIFIYFNF